MRTKEPIKVSVQKFNNRFLLASQEDEIHIWIDSNNQMNSFRYDFCAWFFLPIAMRTGRDLMIQGSGSKDSQRNAQRMSETWESWLPHHFNAVNVTFDTADQPNPVDAKSKPLCFYSGGIDSTHALLRRHLDGKTQALLTVHGMDYKAEDTNRFEALKLKTREFSSLVGNEHFFIKTNAYKAYDKYCVNQPGSHFSHIFALGGAAFLFSERYGDFFIAADYRIDQQFMTHPWGSNSATNLYFDDGRVRMVTLDDDISRSEKMPLLSSSEQALKALSFCKNYEARPHNCGDCQKCVRTKLMFFAANGEIPSIFINNEIPVDWYSRFNIEKNYQKAFLIDIINTARSNNRLQYLPGWNHVLSLLKKPPAQRVSGGGFVNAFKRKNRQPLI